MRERLWKKRFRPLSNSSRKQIALLALLSAIRLTSWQFFTQAAGPLGSDPALWGLTAYDLEAGIEPWAMPLYPWLMTLWPGGVLQGGLVLSWLASWALPIAVWWAIVPFGKKQAAWAGLGTLLLPDGMIMAFQLQPDALTSLWAVLLAGALLRNQWSLIAPLALIGLFLREHGLPVFLLVGLLSLLTQKRRIARTALLFGVALSLPMVFGGDVGIEQPWSSRSEQAFSLLTTQERPPHLNAEEWRIFREKGVAGRALSHSQRSLELSPDLWSLAFVAGSLLIWSRRRDLLRASVVLWPIGVTLLLWSERRHVAVVGPTLLVLIALGSQHRTKFPLMIQRLLGIVFSLALLGGLTRLPHEAEEQKNRMIKLNDTKRVAEILCKRAESHELIFALEQLFPLFCPRIQLSDPKHPLAAKSWLIAPPESIAEPWIAQEKIDSKFWFYRLDPTIRDILCPPKEPHLSRHLLATGPTPHPAFQHVPMAGHPKVPLSSPEICP